MYYIQSTDKSFDQASDDLQVAVKNHSFGVLHIHDIGETLRGKGVEYDGSCRVFEVCNPVQANKVLNIDMRLNMALPCRISVYVDQGKTQVGLIKPADMLSGLSDNDELMAIANEVEKIMIQIVDETI